MRERINEEYFEWLYELVYKYRRHSGPDNGFRILLSYLHNTEFRYLIPRDRDRAEEGVYLRYRFASACTHDGLYQTITDCLRGPCSVLEMMVALALHCEENIMDDPSMGDRTGQWFWEMIVNLGLGSMTDNRFDEEYVEEVIDRFLDREYEPDGRGGLFRIRGCDVDLTTVEIWHQLNWYINTIT